LFIFGRHVTVLSLLVVLLGGCSPSAESAEPFDDERNFGHPDSVLFWSPDQQLASFRNYDRIFPTRAIRASDHPRVLPERLRDISQVRYEVDGDTFDLQGFKEHNHVVGLLAIKDGAIAFEDYDRGNTAMTKWVSYSVAKSVVSMLVGGAVRDGYIASVDDPVAKYLPLLGETSYDGVTIREALRMSSGVAWNEDYEDPESDVSNEFGLTALERLRYLGRQPRVAAPGEVFNYNTGETHLIGGVLRAAIGNNLSTYLAAKIWGPFGMESEANWMLVEPNGAEHGGCCISATLRDYGRIGLFALSGGVLPDGSHVLPERWMEESTIGSPANEGYGYLWWLGEGDVYSALGIFGQAISIDPTEALIIVTHGVWPQASASEYWTHREAFFAALTDALRD